MGREWEMKVLEYFGKEKQSQNRKYSSFRVMKSLPYPQITQSSSQSRQRHFFCQKSCLVNCDETTSPLTTRYIYQRPRAAQFSRGRSSRSSSQNLDPVNQRATADMLLTSIWDPAAHITSSQEKRVHKDEAICNIFKSAACVVFSGACSGSGGGLDFRED